MASDSESYDGSDSDVSRDYGSDDGHYHGHLSYYINDEYQDYEETDSYQSEEDIEEVYLEFDGASRGNPGRAGAGAVLKFEDGAVITRVREGLGIGTNNDAEYRALIRGLKTALEMGYDVIHVKGDSKLVCKQVYLEFDGASRGNPGPAGAGAVLKSEDGAVITRVREGLGRVTNNDAEYRALIRGLKTALNMGYDVIHVKGDSKLVCKQVRGEWCVRSDKLARYCDEALELIDQFKEFNIEYFPRDQNTDADREANRAADLPEGRIYWEYNWHY
ncbi:uncharacterized protein LOC109826269 [Asparagus officinalis]|uniref:uncharacterized protein LOC109826269 n=1 Tax=Asparagus officinalis TaxID=4686 RepID=UPI00098E25F0|nr:uncharacterized protein LOC109826269 [Asparagus officinalis]